VEIRSIESIVKALNDAKVQYLIVGGLAVNAHGFVRLTRDMDIVLRLNKKNVLRGLQAFFKIGYRLAIPARPEDFADKLIRERWRTEKNMIVLKLWSDNHRRTPVDIFVYEPFDFARELRQADNLEICPGVSAKIVTLKTLLAMKRAASRPQDLIDIEELQRIK
jgi:predicted nucleotidyltransferase